MPLSRRVEAQDFTEWECDGTPILMRGGVFHYIVPDPANPGELIVEAIPGTSGVRNSTGFDPVTNLVYGVGSVGGEKVVRAYDATGAIVFDTQIQDPYPDDASTYSGTVLGDGRYIIHSVGAGNGNGWYNGARFNLWSIDPVTGAATYIGPTPVNLADLSYNPLDGYLYHAVNRVLYKVDPNTGATTSTPTSTALPNGAFGASWFDSAGALYLFKNNPGDIYRIDPNDPSDVTLVGTVGANGGTDGANCVSSIDITKDVVDGSGAVVPGDRVYAPGDTVTYKITLINNGLPTQNRTVDLCDVLPGDGRTYTGVWSSTDPAATVTNGGGAGDTSICLEVDMPSSLWTDPANPGSDPTEVTFEVLLGDDMVPGEYENQATLDFDQDGTIDVLSDDPGDSSDPRDPTTIQITGGFEVSKTVTGHPVSNDTDGFEMTVVCTTASGDPHDVGASSIVDAATGAQWPGATANSFTITNADDVRVEDVPAGTSCEITEADSTAYTSTVEVSGGGGGAASATAEITIDQLIADSQIDYTNSTSTLALSKGTSAAGGLPIDVDGTFTFDVTCDNGLSETVSLTTMDGSSSIAYPTTPLIAAGVNCTVSENVPAGWQLTTPNDVAVVTEAGTTAGATFENDRQLADLTISKVVIGLPSGIDPTSLTFEATVTCVGGFDSDPYTVTADFSVGAPLVIEDLPVGASCSVTETPVDGFTTRYSPGLEVEIDADGEQVQITNSTGSLLIEKTTEVPATHPIDPVGSFDFTLECSGSGGDTTTAYTVDADSLVTDGATGGISHSEVGVLAPGTVCNVTELDAGADWALVGASSQTLTVTEAEPEPTASFVNARNVGSLTVTKTLDGVPAGIDLDDELFDVVVTCAGGFTTPTHTIAGQISVNTPLEITDLPTGASCSVVETPDARFAASVGPAVTIDTDGGSINVTNSTSTFSLAKTTTSTVLVDDVDGTFTFAIVCTDDGIEVANLFVSVTTVDGVGNAITGALPLVPPGSACTVTETVPAGWKLTGRSGGTPSGPSAIGFTTEAAGTALSFENTLDTTTLTIDKDVTGFAVTPELEAESFTINVECTGNVAGGTYTSGDLTIVEGTSVDIAGLPVGAECSVAETADSRFTTTYSPADTVTLAETGNTITVVNATSTFSLFKETSVPGGTEPDATFEFSIECSFDGSVVYTETVYITTVDSNGAWFDAPFLPPGSTCTAIESPATGWTPFESSIDLVTSATVTEEISFTNVRDTADLTITKTLVGIPDDLNFDDEEFTVNATCTGDFESSPLILTGLIVTANAPLVIPDVPTGAECTVTEDFDSRFERLYAPENADGTAAVVTIDDDGTEAGMINAGGVLAIRKDTIGPDDHPLGLLDDFDFNLSCTNGYSGIHTLSVDQLSGGQGIGVITYTELPVFPIDTVCTVTEVALGGWTVTSANPQTFTIVEDPGTAHFINERDAGTLTVTKTLDGVPAGVDLSDEPFTIDITCTGGGLTVDPYIISGETITANTPLTVSDLPTGSVCSVVETPDARFATTIGPAVTIDPDGVSINVTNTTSTLSISKITTGPTTHPLVLDATFEFAVSCLATDATELFSETQTITTDAQAGTWVTPDTPLLPPGTECTVTEQTPPTGWTNTSGAQVEVITDAAAIVDVAFTNERQTDSLTIDKIISGSPIDLSDEEFIVDVSCSGDFTTSPYEITGLVVTANADVIIDDLPTGATCVVTEREDDRFLPSYGPDDATSIIGDGASLVDIDNRTGTFFVEKQVTTDSTQSIDLSGTFLVDVTCTDGTDLTLTMEVVDGVAETTESGDVPLLPEGTGCTVTEQAATGWTLSTPNDIEVIISSFDQPVISFTNDRDTADLEVSKVVLGAPVGLDVAAQVFTVDVSCVGDFVSSPLTFLDQEIRDGETLTFADLPTGAVCTVSEDPDSRFATTMAPGDAATVGVTVADAGANVAIVNATGEIMIVKNTVVDSGLAVDVTESFVFDIDCGATYSDEHTVVAGTVTSATTATGFLRYDDLPALPDGTVCTVSEQAAPAGWALTSSNDVVLTVDSDGVVVAAFTNERTTGSLTVTKTLDGVPVGTDFDDELFDVTVTCVGGLNTASHVASGQISLNTPFEVEGLPTGASCSVVEDADPRFSTTIGPAVTIDADGESINVTNTTSTLSISKATSGPTTHPLVLDTTFEFTVSCLATDGTELFSGTHAISPDAQSGTWATPDTPLLPPGTVCSISEVAQSGWTATTATTQSVTTDAASVGEAGFANVRDAGTLTITKTLDGVPVGTDLDAELFDVTITCAGGFTTPTHTITGQISVDAPLEITDLPAGSVCSVVEDADARFSTLVDDPALITVDGETINVTNTTSTLAIRKTTTGPTTHPLVLDATFEFAVSCLAADGTEVFSETQTITTNTQTGAWATPNTPLLPPGTVCTVTEQTPPTGWTNTSGAEVEVITDAAAIVDAGFTNERDTATLTVNKTVFGAPDGVGLNDELFDITVTCMGDFETTKHTITGEVSANTPLEISDLPTGANCEIVEADDARFQTDYFPANGTGDAATAIVEDTGSSVDIANSTGEVILAKQTIVSPLHPIDPVADFTFTIDCGAAYIADHTLTTENLTASGASGAIFYDELPLLPEGTVCEITEHDETPEWSLATDRTVTVTATTDNPVTASFINARSQTSLTIEKEVEGPPGVDLTAETFEVTVTCSGGFTEEPYVIVGTMSQAAPFVVDELPYGAECSADETPDDRFTSIDQTGAVTLQDSPSTIDILNQTGSFVFELDTIINSIRPLDPDDAFEFIMAATLPDGTVIETVIDMTTVDGNGTWQSPLHPAGTVVTVSLIPEDWTLTNRDGQSIGTHGIEVEIGTDVESIAFDVERDLASLTISKQLANVPPAADFAKRDFVVSVTCAGGFVAASYQLPETFTVSSATPLTIDDLPTGTTCEVTEVADELFDASYGPSNSVTIAAATAGDDGGNKVTITNTGTDALANAYAQPGGALAFTGSEIWSLLRLALLFLAAGTFLLVVRRKDPEEELTR